MDEIESRSMLSFCTSIGILPHAATPSTWNKIPLSCAISPISRIGWIVPISPFAYITEIRIVSSRISCSIRSTSTSPSLSTGTNDTSKPSRCKSLQVLIIDICSITVVTICLPLLFFLWAAPRRAILLDSVPPDVKIILSLSAPIRDATDSLAVASARLALIPELCKDAGFPTSVFIYDIIFSITRLSTGAPEALSM